MELKIFLFKYSRRCTEKARPRPLSKEGKRSNITGGGMCLFYKVCYAAREIALPAYNTTETLAVYVQGTRHRDIVSPTSRLLVGVSERVCYYKANRRLRCAVDCARRH